MKCLREIKISQLFNINPKVLGSFTYLRSIFFILPTIWLCIIILFASCYIINNHRCSSLKQHTFIGVISHYLCHTLSVRSKSQILLKLKGKGLHKGVNTSRWGSLGSTLGLFIAIILINSIYEPSLYDSTF